MNKEILLIFILVFLLLNVNSVFASNTVSVTPDTYFDVSSNVYNSSFSKTDGSEKDYDVYGVNLPLYYGPIRNIEYFNSTVGYDAQVDGIEHLSSPFIVESGPVRVLIHGENTSNIPLSDINCAYNYSIDVYSYPNYYFVNYRDWGNFTQIRLAGNGFRMYEFEREDVDKSRLSYWGRANISGILIPNETMRYTNESYIFLWNGSHTATIGYFVNRHNFAGRHNISVYFGDRPKPFIGEGVRSTQTSAEWSWITWFGNNGGGDLNINETVNNRDFKSQFLEYYYPATITSISGTYQQRDNITGTYNFTVDSNGLSRFNFSTSNNINHTYPIFHIKDTTSSASSYKDHIWYKNYSQSNAWQQLTNYTDFVIQDGNSTYFGYNYTLLLINKTLGSDYEFWINNDTDPPSNITITIESDKMSSNRQTISRPNSYITVYGHAFYKDLENTSYANKELNFTYDTRNLGSNTTNGTGYYWFTFSIPYEGTYNLTVSATDTYNNTGENTTVLYITTHPIYVKFKLSYHLGTTKTDDVYRIGTDLMNETINNLDKINTQYSNNLTHAYVCTYDKTEYTDGLSLSLVHSYKNSDISFVNFSTNSTLQDYTLELKQKIENAQLLLTYTKIPSIAFSSFSYPIPKDVPILIQFKSDRIQINGTDRFSAGSHKICAEKSGISLGNKPIINVGIC